MSAHARGLFSVIFLHFLQKYRCVPKIGFSADIFLSISFIFFRSIVVYLKLGSRLTFLLAFFFDISIDILVGICIDIFIGICIDILTDKEEGRGGKEGRSGLLLKI